MSVYLARPQAYLAIPVLVDRQDSRINQWSSRLKFADVERGNSKAELGEIIHTENESLPRHPLSEVKLEAYQTEFSFLGRNQEA
jgi:hypothetical protein